MLGMLRSVSMSDCEAIHAMLSFDSGVLVISAGFDDNPQQQLTGPMV